LICPLCGSNHTVIVDFISKESLNNVYLKEYQTDISNDVNSDMHLRHCRSCDLKYFDPCYTGGQNFYTDLQKFEWYYKDDKFEYDYVTPYVKGSVLEVGCGKGAFSAKIKTKKYKGLEFSETARDTGLGLGRDIVTESIEEHAFKNPEAYDTVVSFQVLEHTSNPRSFVDSCVRALKPGGTLVLTVPSEDSFLQHIQDFALNMPPHHVTKWTDKCLINLEKEFNIKCVHLYHEPLNSFHIPWYFTSMVVYQLNKALGISHSLIRSPRHWLSHKIAKVLFNVLGKDLPSAYQGHGHTVIAVYKKSANGRPK
jgi:2-polyprenyl-3-methyl-5-hydroxy-6-metoxy-1,4-benzoquinol methylase